MSEPAALSRDEVVGMLAAFGQRSPDEVAERIGSLELTWLISQVETRYGVTLELTDDELDQMTTITGAVTALHDALAGAEHA